tara:strand:+ start:198 stop:359 length:162 start_codon:yes stop_codon:yes gene_type:complete
MNSDPDQHERLVYEDEKAQNEPYVPIRRWERFKDRYTRYWERLLDRLLNRSPF